MSIASRQVTNEVNRIIEEKIKAGDLPTVDYIIAELSRFYQRILVGFPSFKLRTQPYRKVWDVNSYNSNISEVYEDINNLYAELVDQFTVVLQDFDYTDTERQRILHEIKSLEGDIQTLSLLSSDISGNLYSAYETFKDRSKVDLKNSTVSIDTDSGMCTIGESTNGISKVDMSQYYNTVNFPIEASSQYSDNIVSNTIMTGSKFGDAFSDTTSSWIQNIITRSPGQLQVSFIINISPDDPAGTLISRIEMDGQSPNPMQIQPLWSLDNINFTSLPMGYGTDIKDVGTGSTTVWNFTDTKAVYIKFIITKKNQDQSTTINGSPSYTYVIGFKNISIYKMGYNTSSVLYSEPFTVTDPTGDQMTIDKASIIVDQDVEPGTSIDYYLSLGIAGDSNPLDFSWTPVSAVNDPMPTQQQLVDFRQAATFADVPTIQWDVSSYGNTIEKYNGISFYYAYQFPYLPVKNSIILSRGHNDWQVIPQYSVSRVSVYDEVHTFGSSNSISLSFPNFTPVAGQGLIRGSVKVKNEPGQNPGYVYNTPSDFTVNYGTYTVTKTSSSTIASDPNSPRNTVYVDYQYDKETSLPSEYITYVYVLNTNGININITPWSSSLVSAGEYTTIETSGNIVDVSSLTSYHLSPGWHQIVTTGQPYTSDDRFISANNGQRLDQIVYTQYAFSTALQEVSWFELKYNTPMSDHSKYAVYDYNQDGKKELIVNYRPQTTGWYNGLDMLCHFTPETYVISYKYISALTNTIYLKAILSRNDTTTALSTPTLRSYTIKMGY